MILVPMGQDDRGIDGKIKPRRHVSDISIVRIGSGTATTTTPHIKIGDDAGSCDSAAPIPARADDGVTVPLSHIDRSYTVQTGIGCMHIGLSGNA